jgi:hypothetical protein
MRVMFPGHGRMVAAPLELAAVPCWRRAAWTTVGRPGSFGGSPCAPAARRLQVRRWMCGDFKNTPSVPTCILTLVRSP